MNKERLGQVFTPLNIVKKMVNLITFINPNLVLEPSSGTGNFYFELIKKYDNVIGVEIDQNIAHKGALVKSYFETKFKADVIIGNPPYVEFKNIYQKPQSNILVHKPNLFHFFLQKALDDLNDNGELIWIVSSSIFTNSSAKELNKKIFHDFSITYWEQMPENIWQNAAVPTAIVKIVKQKNHPQKLDYFLSNGKIIFGNRVMSIADVVIKVGGASGFKNNLSSGPIDLVDSQTERTKQTIKITYEPKKWIRPVPKAPKNFKYMIFVNTKTRNKHPFYMLENLKQNEFIHYDAAVLAIYTFSNINETKDLMDKLNNFDWEKAGIKKDGRFHFSQSILHAMLC